MIHLVLALALSQTIYRWTDARGEVHYTDDATSIPRGAKVQTTEGEELTVVPASKTPTPSKPSKPSPTKPAAAEVTVRITRYDVEVSEVDRQFIETSVREAAASPRLATWGGLRRAVTGTVASASTMKNGEAFGMAAGTQFWLIGPTELRQYSARPMIYREAALHEFGHLVEDQWAGGARPRWFAEGFACYVADFERAATIDEIAYWVIAEGGPTPLERAFSQRINVHLAYAIAHEALKFLVTLIGERGVRDMFALRANGASFDKAFERAAGFSVADFQRRFAESLRPHYFERSK